MTENELNIRRLRAEGKSYRQIEKELGIAKSLVAYYCSPNARKQCRDRQQKRRVNNPLRKKIEDYCVYIIPFEKQEIKEKRIEKFIYWKYRNFGMVQKGRRIWKNPDFTTDQLMKKIGENPTCYITRRAY